VCAHALSLDIRRSETPINRSLWLIHVKTAATVPSIDSSPE
jgi:hypothetical protein